MRKLGLLTIIIFVLIGCTPNLEKGKATNLLEIISLVHLADSTFKDSINLNSIAILKDSIDLNSIFDFKTIDLRGSINKIDKDKAISLLTENIENEKPKLYPIFEIKKSTNVILPIYGQGLWGKIFGIVLIDKKTLKIINIEFSHQGETPGFGAKIKDDGFKKQFIGQTIELQKNTFSLYQAEKRIIIGKQKIDGISGATITSKGVIDMLNQGITVYKNYLL